MRRCSRLPASSSTFAITSRTRIASRQLGPSRLAQRAAVGELVVIIRRKARHPDLAPVHKLAPPNDRQAASHVGQHRLVYLADARAHLAQHVADVVKARDALGHGISFAKDGSLTTVFNRATILSNDW